MELFPFIKIFFSKPKEYDKLKSYDKTRNKFMLQRFMAIRYPEAAHDKVFEPLESTIKYYMEKNEIGNREYKEALKFNKNGILRELQSIENQINVV